MKKQNRLAIFLIYSIAAHIGFFAFLLVTSHLSKSTSEAENAIEITMLDQNEIQQPNNASVIVETDSKTANEKIDAKSKYLSEKNNTVEKETRAQNGSKFLNAQNLTKPQLANKGNKGTAKSGAQQKPDLFKNDFDAYSTLNKQVAAGEAHNQGASTKTAEASTTNDNLQNVENDFLTRLNTREYKYYGYYTRIKNQLNQWWVPQVQQKFTKMMRQGRTIASENSKVTKLVIVLNGKGNLVKVQVLAASGVRDLDDAAIEAFRQAAPFPNPPKGMIETDGTVKIRWDCVVES